MTQTAPASGSCCRTATGSRPGAWAAAPAPTPPAAAALPHCQASVRSYRLPDSMDFWCAIAPDVTEMHACLYVY